MSSSSFSPPKDDFSKELKSIRKMVNWRNAKERSSFLDRVLFLIKNWNGQLPDLRDIFRPEEMDWLLTEDFKNRYGPVISRRNCNFIKFVVKAGYKESSDVDKNIKPLLRRTTALHWATRLNYYYDGVIKLFEIYDRFDVNYTDESGLSHFHAACKFGCRDVVVEFLAAGQDPNYIWKETGDSPLHLALANANKEVVELLVRNGADPNLVNEDGSTPLHIISKRETYRDSGLANLFLKYIDEEYQQTLLVDVQDKLCRTSLQWAVANMQPHVLDILLDRGADLSRFIFPNESYFGKKYDPENYRDDITITLASSTLIIVENLEKNGYKLDRSDALMIMTYFAHFEGLFEKSASLDKCWYDNEEFTVAAKEIVVSSSLSLYDLVRLLPEETEKHLTYADYLSFTKAKPDYYWDLPDDFTEACSAHLSEIIMRGFCRRWALESFLELMRHQLSIERCEMFIKQLMNKDLYRICLAAAGYSA
ncbi:hypothetical protein TKK_0010519 [Trichogramma kaykai]|uniref:Uncharacterized protein n=1 Tax=Trichogramma kaykai TaxID=54128 RepID=A0ABD2WX35_9HYME